MKNVTSTTPELLSFISAVNAKKEAYRVELGLTTYSSLTVEVLREGPKYLVLGSFETHAATGSKHHGSVYAFIERATGDIFKPSSFRAPAKGVRGNLFADDNGLARCNHYGPAYNR